MIELVLEERKKQKEIQEERKKLSPLEQSKKDQQAIQETKKVAQEIAEYSQEKLKASLVKKTEEEKKKDQEEASRLQSLHELAQQEREKNLSTLQQVQYWPIAEQERFRDFYEQQE